MIKLTKYTVFKKMLPCFLKFFSFHFALLILLAVLKKRYIFSICNRNGCIVSNVVWRVTVKVTIDLVFFFIGFEKLVYFLLDVYFTSIFFCCYFIFCQKFQKTFIAIPRRSGGGGGGKGVACQRYFWPFTKSHTYRSA